MVRELNERTSVDEPETGRTGIQALDSALVVLRVLSGMSGPASLSDIARQAKMPASKVHRYLASFTKAGFVGQAHKAGHYTLAKGALELGLAAMARMDLVNEAAVHMDELVARTGAAALIAVWGPHGPTVVRWLRTGSFVITSLGLGTTLPLLNSATGRVFLAYSRMQVIERHLQQEVHRAQKQGLRWPDLDPSHPDEITLIARNIRRLGYASVDGRFIPGLNALSAPILNWQGEVEVAVTLTSGDKAILDPASVALELLREACAAVSVVGQSAASGQIKGLRGS
jgi:DNA-binding IclR family transcriptional regulator